MKKMVVMWVVVLIASTWIASASEQAIELVTLAYPPFEYEENGEIKGVAVDIVKETFKRMDRAVKIRVLPWKRALRMVRRGEADGYFTAAKTPDRENFSYFSAEALLYHYASLFVLKDSPIHYDGDLTKLSEYRFGMIRRARYGKEVDKAVKKGIIKNIDLADNLRQNVDKLLKARFHILVSNRLGAIHILKDMNQLDNVRELSPEIQKVPVYIAFSKTRNLASLRDEFDSALRKMKQDGTYNKIINTFFR